MLTNPVHIDLLIIALDTDTPIEKLIDLSDHPDNSIRWRIANNTSTPKEILAKLSKDKFWAVRDYVVGNPNTSIETLVELSKDEVLHVRCDAIRFRMMRMSLLE